VAAAESVRDDVTGAGTGVIPDDVTNGAAMAAFLAAGIGSFAMGIIVILNEVGIYSVPAIYAPAGGVSGRTALATVVWLIAWALLHNRWKRRQIESHWVNSATYTLTVLGLILTFPPVWRLF
jgi:hypothetical protein